MNAVITKKQKNKIMILGGIAGFFGLIAGSVGLYLKEQIITSVEVKNEWIDVFTKGYFGVMSGFSLLLVGTLGYSLVFSRVASLVFFYGCFSLTCNVLCLLDFLMVTPYTETYATCLSNSSSAIPVSKSLESKNCETTAILLLCISIAVSIAMIFSLITTILTTVALCKARAIPSTEQATIQLAPFSTPRDFQPTSYNNTVYRTDGYRK